MILDILFFLAVLLSILGAFWLYDKRTRRLLYRYKETADEVFNRIESRLVHGTTDFKSPVTQGLVWAIMFTYNRKSMAAHTLATLRKAEPTLPILVVDNGSDDGAQSMLLELLQNHAIDKVLLNQHEQVPQWQKGFAMQQALKLLAMERPEFIVWLDDDLEITRPFVKPAAQLLRQLRDERVKIINMTDSEREEEYHPTVKKINVSFETGEEVIKLRRSFNGQFDFISSEFFREFGYPPIAEGINDWGVEDWFYSRLLKANDYRAAVFVAATHLGVQSKREEKT